MNYKYNIGDMFLIKTNNTILYIIDRYADKTNYLRPVEIDAELYMTVHIMGDNAYRNEHNQEFLTYKIDQKEYTYFPVVK